jgi:nitrous oxidase accessory protein
VVASADNRIDLQALVDGRADGDTLQLETGRYSAAVIDRPLILRGRGEATVVDGGGSGTGTVLALKAPGVRIEQLRVTGSGSDIMAKESGIWIDRAAPDAHIRQVRLDSCGFGIWADRAARPLMANCTVIGRDDAAIVSDLGNGIHLFNVEGGIVRDNQIVAGRDGIYISNSSGCLIEGNRVRGSRFAIHYMYAHQNRVIDNSTDSSSVGIALMYSKRIQVRHNRVRNARNHGMLLRNLYASRVEGNDVRGSRDGFFFSGCQADTLAGNRIAANEIGIQVSDSPTNLLVANAFLDNEQQLVYEGYSHVVWEGGENGGNYWSDYIGWDRDGDGIGDKRHYPSDIATHLVGRFPALRLVLHSPAMLLLQGLEAQFPMMRPPGVMEARPLMHLPATREEL